MKINPEVQGHSIVLVGNFNPKIFQPAWFAKEGLLKESDANAAEIQLINSDVVVFYMSWLRLEVTLERFVVMTSQDPYHETLKRLVMETFRLLKHTPVHQMGINWNMDFKASSKEKWNTIGHTLAPKDGIWKPLLKDPGLSSMTIQDARENPAFPGHTNITVRPSKKVDSGILFDVNDHYHLPKSSDENGCSFMMDALQQNWEQSRERVQHVVSGVMENLYK